MDSNEMLGGQGAILAPPPPPANGTLWNWQGASGRWYSHTVYPVSAVPHFPSANYIIARWNPGSSRFDPLYIGESGNFAVRWHEKRVPALSLGGTHILLHLLANSEQERLKIETDIRRAWPAPLNEQGSDLTATG
jgi:hypothetical protein